MDFGFTVNAPRAIYLDKIDPDLRDKLIARERTTLLCIGCGSCTATCTAGQFTGSAYDAFNTSSDEENTTRHDAPSRTACSAENAVWSAHEGSIPGPYYMPYSKSCNLLNRSISL